MSLLTVQFNKQISLRMHVLLQLHYIIDISTK
jgi:hypothetical protein